VLAAAVAALTGLAELAAHVYTDLLWLRELGHTRVYWTTLAWRVLVPAAAGLGTACFVLANLAVVERRTARPSPARRVLYGLCGLGCGVATLEALPDGAWRIVALWTVRGDFGTRDPLFNRDVGFFVFSLPLYQLVAGWLLQTLLLAGAVTAGASLLQRGLRDARAQLLALGALGLLVLAIRLRLEQFALALPHGHGPVTGAGYTDVHVRLPLLRSLTLLALAGAGLAAYAAVRPVPLAAFAVPAGIALAAVGAGDALAAAVQRLAVAPQALSRERPYLAQAITATRHAYALDAVHVRAPSGPATDPAAGDLALWDRRVLVPAMNETQAIGGYYSFARASVDRYAIRGRPRIMAVAVRRLDLAHLPGGSRTWANTHFAYTHGYGVLGVSGGEADADRYPRFAQREFGRGPLRVTEPRIYFGEGTHLDPRYVVVDSRRGEVEQPAPGSTAPAYHYAGTGGIRLSGLLRRAAFALRFEDTQLLLTTTPGPRARILLHRDAGERVRALAPFLRWDARGEPVVAQGRVQWLFHGYTTSRTHPYAAPSRFAGKRVNYVRAAAVAAVDAFDGRVHLYAAEPDPILRAWQRLYPGLLAPLARMPAALRAHLRYPRSLFATQAAVYATYHASDPTGFWNGADAWQPAQQLAGPVEESSGIRFPDPGRDAAAGPARMIARLPGDGRARVLLLRAFTPRGRQNVSAYLAGSVDAAGRPRLIAVSLPRRRLVAGPTQATRRILASPGVGARLQILNRESRDLGHSSIARLLLADVQLVPAGRSLVYVQPVYVSAAGDGLPRLRLVTVLAHGRVGYGPDLRTALARAARAAAGARR
jgi:uncharacterized membrane protein (UPF0182 family)